jgi:gliding motility-associated-like protein
MKKILKCCFILLIIFTGKHCYAQREANIWYFGRYLGLDFNSGAPVPLNDGQLNTTEGVATISDANGSLLFYTEGTKIWNKVHQVMPNGTGLFGDLSSTQSAIIVPKIGDPARYYVITVDQLSGPRGLNYSIVNMTLDNGKGDVELKNIHLQSNVTEKVTAVKHCNNRDIWIVAHGSVSDIYYSFLVSAAGINLTPVVSHAGVVLPGVVAPSSFDSSALGYLKASPNGKKIAAAHWPVNVDVSDFDNATGIVSNAASMYVPGDPHYLSYGIEFSPNSNLLYSTVFYTDPVNAQKHNALYQYDVTSGSAAAIRASRQVISLNSDPIDTYAALQIAPDGKIYMAKRSYKHISSVSNPDVYGPGCVFTSNAVQFTLPTQESSYGLPTFIQSYFYPVDSFTHVVNCPGLNTNFNYVPASNVLSVLWNFDDPASGANNSSTLNNPVHTFSTPGDYTVSLIKFTNCGPDTIKRIVHTNSLSINLGPDILVCGNTNVVLNSAAAGSTNTFLWQDGSVNPTFTATAAGLYWVQATNSLGCSFRDSINVDFKPMPAFNLGLDKSICEGDTLLLNATVTNADSYLWNTGVNTPTIQAFQAGTYWCNVNMDGCNFRDSLIITAVNPSPIVNLGNDATLCEGNTLTLNAAYPNSTFLWQDGSTGSTYTVTQQGMYYVKVDLNGCKKSDTITVNYNLKPRFTLGPDQFICQGSPVTLAPVTDPSWQLSWQDGTHNQSYTVAQPGTYILTATNNCGSATDEILFSKGQCRVYVPNAFTPNADGRNDLFKALGTELVTQFNLRIFNRYGQVVFETSDKSKGWDGKFNSKPSPGGAFVYVLSYKEMNDPQPVVQKATFLLIR